MAAGLGTVLPRRSPPRLWLASRLGRWSKFDGALGLRLMLVALARASLDPSRRLLLPPPPPPPVFAERVTLVELALRATLGAGCVGSCGGFVRLAVLELRARPTLAMLWLRRTASLEAACLGDAICRMRSRKALSTLNLLSAEVSNAGTSLRTNVERGAAEWGAAERGAVERGAAERGAAERGAAERGAAERGTARRPWGH